MKIEVLNKWSSPSDQAALDFLCRSASDYATLEDRKFSGNLIDAIESRRREQRAPLLVKMHGQDLGLCDEATDLSGILPEAMVADLPESLRYLMRCADRIIGIPVGLHRANSLFASRPVLDAFGIPLPRTLEELTTAARILLESGIKPFAVGSDPMLLGFLFENVSLAAGGPRYHRAVCVDCEDEALRCATTLEVVQLWSNIVRPSRIEDRPWRDLGAEIKRGDAAILACGDFACSHMLEEAETTGVAEIAFPGTAESFVFIADFFTPVGFTSENEIEALRAIAARWTEPDVVRGFCRRKGALPPACAVTPEGALPSVLAKQEACRQAISGGTFLLSMTLEQAVPHRVRAAFLHALTHQAKAATEPRAVQSALAEAVAAAQKPTS
jgi:glucose/mannose transport system substrate-binding protein